MQTGRLPWPHLIVSPTENYRSGSRIIRVSVMLGANTSRVSAGKSHGTLPRTAAFSLYVRSQRSPLHGLWRPRRGHAGKHRRFEIPLLRRSRRGFERAPAFAAADDAARLA